MRSRLPTWSAVGRSAPTTSSPTELVQEVLENSGYLEDLKSKGTDEDHNRIENIQELYSAVVQFEEENEDATLLTFLANASLNSDNDDNKEKTIELR